MIEWSTIFVTFTASFKSLGVVYWITRQQEKSSQREEWGRRYSQAIELCAAESPRTRDMGVRSLTELCISERGSEEDIYHADELRIQEYERNKDQAEGLGDTWYLLPRKRRRNK